MDEADLETCKSVVTLSQMDPKLKLEPGLCDRYMIQRKGGSGTQFMEIDILNFGSFYLQPLI